MTHCGTERGWRAHRSANEPACQWCKSWKAKDEAGTVEAIATPTTKQKSEALSAAKPRPKSKKPRSRVKCGTPAGYRKHVADNTPVCEPCREARNEQRRELYANKNRTKRKHHKVAPCGTQAGYLRHLREGGAASACDECRTANTVASAKYRARTKAEAQA